MTEYEERTCIRCNGVGEAYAQKVDRNGKTAEGKWITCPDCNGTGTRMYPKR